MGGQANADQFMRYYIAPGVDHCAGGPGADTTDLLNALDKWVMRGKAPGTLTAEKLDPTTGSTLLSRPLCIYPAYPQYSGRGDPNVSKPDLQSDELLSLIAILEAIGRLGIASEGSQNDWG